jgi:hypothetical protein
MNPITRASAPLGIIRILVCVINDGTKIQSAHISTNGIAAICGLFAKYLSPNAPNKAVTTLLNAGCNTGALKTG